jgi:hypothetical protein
MWSREELENVFSDETCLWCNFKTKTGRTYHSWGFVASVFRYGRQNRKRVFNFLNVGDERRLKNDVHLGHVCGLDAERRRIVHPCVAFCWLFFFFSIVTDGNEKGVEIISRLSLCGGREELENHLYCGSCLCCGIFKINIVACYASGLVLFLTHNIEIGNELLLCGDDRILKITSTVAHVCGLEEFG